MMRVDSSGKAALLGALVVVCASGVACGGGSGSAASQAVSTSNPATAMRLAGTPATTAAVGQAYSFQPTLDGTAGVALKFAIANTPAWAKFDPATGRLTGTPSASHVGTYRGITISVIAGTATAVLPAFSIVVTDVNSHGNVTLSWQAPSENADGSALIDLRGYKVHYGSATKSYSDTIQLSNPGLTTYVVDNLRAGKYYFAITAYNAAGQESSLSPEISTQVD